MHYHIRHAITRDNIRLWIVEGVDEHGTVTQLLCSAVAGPAAELLDKLTGRDNILQRRS